MLNYIYAIYAIVCKVERLENAKHLIFKERYTENRGSFTVIIYKANTQQSIVWRRRCINLIGGHLNCIHEIIVEYEFRFGRSALLCGNVVIIARTGLRINCHTYI